LNVYTKRLTRYVVYCSESATLEFCEN